MARPVARSSFFQPKQITLSTYFQAVRCYSASAGLSQDEVTGRIMDLLKNFDKVKALFIFQSRALANIRCRFRILQRY
jgi:NADH dehydrogenase (ubiquinone) 1 alpha/beta subcomplex 1